MPRPPADFRAKVVRYDSPFTEPAVKPLACHFRRGFPLQVRLDHAGLLFLAFESSNEPTPRQRRERLERVVAEEAKVSRGRTDRAEALALLLLRAPGGLSVHAHHVEHCFDRDPELPGARAVLPVAFDAAQLAGIRRAVKSAQRGKLCAGSPGRNGDAGLRVLMRELAAIWTEGTGRQPTVTTKPDRRNKRAGDFLAFAVTVARALGAETSEDALWSLHQRWSE